MHRIRLFQSSSTKLAIFFSAILSSALGLLCIEIYLLTHGEDVQPEILYAILGLILFICAGLFFISFYVTKRINSIVITASNIIATRDLTQRIPAPNRWDDLSRLAQVLNLMLEKIEQAVASTRQVSDNIAHDLRTPLTRLRNHIEQMRNGVRETDPQWNEFGALAAECDSLLTTFNALLRIANIEAGRRNPTLAPLNLAPVVEDVIALYEPIASERGIHLHYRAEPCMIAGDKDLLFQALANLLDNALKHTPAAGDVVLTLTPLPSGARIVLTDTGVGIEDAHKTQVFSRFYRVDASRHQPGVGLGLSLVQAIISLHKGTITLSDHHPSGLTVTITL